MCICRRVSPCLREYADLPTRFCKSASASRPICLRMPEQACLSTYAYHPSCAYAHAHTDMHMHMPTRILLAISVLTQRMVLGWESQAAPLFSQLFRWELSGTVFLSPYARPTPCPVPAYRHGLRYQHTVSGTSIPSSTMPCSHNAYSTHLYAVPCTAVVSDTHHTQCPVLRWCTVLSGPLDCIQPEGRTPLLFYASATQSPALS